MKKGEINKKDKGQVSERWWWWRQL